MKQTGYPFWICCKNNPSTRLDCFFVFLSTGRLKPGKILANRATFFALFNLSVLPLRKKKKKKKENEERQQSKKSPCTREKVLCSTWRWPATLDISSGKCVSFLAWFVQVVKPYYYCKAYFTWTHKHKYAYFYEVSGNKAVFVSSKYNSFLLA